ncbi:MAG: helix-turn-helix transcriptional regulator [Candidatus Thiodiazotropha sp. (ex Troendleina suluensis)]|nr:helix-turn-helix transcriptional regulator [Candidatus Thiodiazotropha sp. (ex Troendleina suluensis)]
MPKVKKLDEVQLSACRNLKKIYDSKKESLGLTLDKMAEIFGYKTHAAVSHILNGRRALTLELLIGFCQLLKAHPREICPVMAYNMEKVMCPSCHMHETPIVYL